MTAPIRPSFPQAQSPAASRATDAARAAQRAFFDAALGKAQAVPAPEPPKASVAAPSVRSARAAQASSEPDRLLRPGSLLNIRV